MEKIVPIIPIRDGIIFPSTDSVLTFGRPKSLAALESSFSQERIVGFVLQKNSKLNEPSPTDLYNVGTLSHIERMIKSDGEINAQVKGLSRIAILEYVENSPYLTARVEEVEEVFVDSPEIKALTNHLIAEFKRAINLGKFVDFLVFMNVMSENTPSSLADLVSSVLELKPGEKQTLLEELDVKKRLEKAIEFLSREIKVLELERKIASKTQERFEKGAREIMLRERLKTIEKELGESDEDSEIKELMDKLKKAGMPEDIEEKAKKEIRKLAQMNQFNPESGYIRNYLDWLTDMPWDIQSPNNVSIAKAAKILEKDHYGIKKVKERILEYLAVMQIKKESKKNLKEDDKDKSKDTDQTPNVSDSQPTILCFIGPPGVGKTSIGKSIARALGRKFVRMSLGGIRDEAEIRGHRRTYVGALPGRIIQGVKNAGTKNPVFMLDEIDKIGIDFRGDPSSALLEALDPEQNREFSDHYLEVPFDLSQVMFICTGNVMEKIPVALRDRMEVIRFPGYTQDEKYNIAKQFLWPKQLRLHGLEKKEIKAEKSALDEIINRYTREAGVRELERSLATAFRKIARLVAEGKNYPKVVKITDVRKFLGPQRFSSQIAEKNDEAGMATGLAVTAAGGEILFIEVALTPGKGKLTLTGQLGDVMKESAKAAFTWAKAHYLELGLNADYVQAIDVHVHVPEGAVPKDGPSAGTAIATALVSALTGVTTKRDVAMTGEITLRGRVLEIGGVKEKVIAGHRAGLKKIVLPKDNEKDMEDVPEKVQKDIKFVFASSIDEVLEQALNKWPVVKEKPTLIRHQTYIAAS